MEGTWKTTSGGGRGLPGPVAGLGLLIGAAIVVKYIIVPVMNLAVEIIRIALITAGALTAVALAAVVTYRVRRGHFPALRLRTLPAARPAPAARTVRAIPADSDRSALATPEVHTQTHIHIHLGGQSPEADAAAVRALTERAG
jgi:hypothetical protein